MRNRDLYFSVEVEFALRSAFSEASATAHHASAAEADGVQDRNFGPGGDSFPRCGRRRRASFYEPRRGSRPEIIYMARVGTVVCKPSSLARIDAMHVLGLLRSSLANKQGVDLLLVTLT